MTQLYGNIYSQVDPIRLGSVVRANNIAMHYGERLGSKNLKSEALGSLVLGYPSHDFVIDREQAAELFHCVREPTSGEEALVELVEADVTHPAIRPACHPFELTRLELPMQIRSKRAPANPATAKLRAAERQHREEAGKMARLIQEAVDHRRRRLPDLEQTLHPQMHPPTQADAAAASASALIESLWQQRK